MTGAEQVGAARSDPIIGGPLVTGMHAFGSGDSFWTGDVAVPEATVSVISLLHPLWEEGLGCAMLGT